MNRIILFLCFFLIVFSACSQTKYYTKSRKAIKNYEKALETFQRYDYSSTADYLDQALKADNNFIEAHLLYAQIFVENKQAQKALEVYDFVIKTDSEYFPMVWLYRGNTAFESGTYTIAKESFVRFLTFPKKSKRYKTGVEKLIKQCDFAIHAMENPVPFEPINMGQGVNSDLNEYAPALTVDGKTLFFTRLVPTPSNDMNMETFNEDFYTSGKVDNQWAKALNIGRPLNSVFNEGAPAISADGRIMAYISCVCRDGIQKCCDVYLSKNVGGKWLAPKNIGLPVNTPAWESQPSLSADGRTLYFVSNRKGGFGGKDIWVAHLGDNEQWSEPKNLGDSINTPQDEISPFIHPDNETLYFGSNGYIGMGKMDLFVSRLDSSGKWCSPKNLGYPINTHQDEGSLILNAHGDLAMFASERDSGFGGLDLYSFEMPKQMRPVKVNYVHGVIYDSISKKKLRADFELFNLSTGKRVFKSNSDPINGKFLVCLPIGKNYAFNVDKPGYLFYSEHFSLIEDSASNNLFLDIPLIPIKKGERVILRNVFFDTDKYVLKPESYIELDKLYQFLKRQPKVKIELGGHTDNMGSAEHNKTLSENRAKAVFEYLQSKGIPAERVSYKGYGFEKPIDTNDTEEGRGNNRRTEFIVLSN